MNTGTQPTGSKMDILLTQKSRAVESIFSDLGIGVSKEIHDRSVRYCNSLFEVKVFMMDGRGLLGSPYIDVHSHLTGKTMRYQDVELARMNVKAMLP